MSTEAEICDHVNKWSDTRWDACLDCGAGLGPRRAPLRVSEPKHLPAHQVEALLSAIRKGAFIWVACQAAGIPTATLTSWRRKAKQPDLYPEHAAFAHELDVAFAEARIVCEIEVARAEPKYWLSKGPGRDRGNPDQPGWTDGTAKIEVSGDINHNLIPRFDLSKLTDAELDEQERLSTKAAIIEITSGEPHGTDPTT